MVPAAVAAAGTVAAAGPAAGSSAAAWVLTCALTVAVASLLAAFFLRGGNGRGKRGGSAAAASGVAIPSNASGTVPVAQAGRTLASTGAGSVAAAPSAGKRPVASASASGLVSALSLECRALPRVAAASASAAPRVAGGPPLESGRELWLLRAIAVQRLLAAASQAAKRHVWRFLDDRPRTVATGCGDGQGRIFNLATGKLQVSVRHDFSNRQALTTVLLMPGPQLLTTTWDGKWHTWDEWPTKPARPGEVARGEKGVGHENSICGIAISRDGNLLACACTVGRILVYRSNCPTVVVDVQTAEDMERLRENIKMGDNSELYLIEPMELGGVRLERKMALLQEAAFKTMSSRRDLTKLELPARLHFRFVGCMTHGHRRAWRTLEHEDAVRCLALIAEGSGEYLYSGSRDRTIRKWNIRTGSCAHTYSGHSAAVRCLTVNGSFLVSGSDDRTLRVWKKDEAMCIRKITGHTDFVRAVALCRTFQTRLVSSCDDLKVYLWDVSTGERLREYEHAGFVHALVLHESLLITACEDKHLRVWEVESATCQQQVRHPAPVTALSAL